MHVGSTSPRKPFADRLVFDRAPQRIYWEITRACDLACRHCRAEASPLADPHELSPEEGQRLLQQLASFGDPLPHVILTGGDPLKSADLWDLIARGRELGMGVAVSPSATPLVTKEVVARLARAGVEAISLSVDGSTAERHDALRGVPGCFARTLEAGKAAAEARLPVQVNTLVSEETYDDLPQIHRVAREICASRWSLFFLVSVGRGTVLNPISSAQCDRLFEWLTDLPRGEGWPIVTTTEAPHFRRVVRERHKLPTAAGHGGAGIRDGNGVMFISSTGDVYPSGFLPVAAGNVRLRDPVAIYRDAPMFTVLRSASEFGGRCGVCSFQRICGGSRARAYAATGDVLAEDPLCSYQPK
jgi:MoaA/NifB/PqqE/SkfB family radical SAM enzyme